MDINTFIVIPIAIIIIVVLLYSSVSYTSIQKPEMVKDSVLKAGLIVFIIYYTSIDIRYGFFAFVVSVIVLHTIGFYQEFQFLQAKTQAVQYMTNVIDRLNQTETQAVQTIPKIIMQIWVQKDNSQSSLPSMHAGYMKQIRQMNPDFQYFFFEKTEVENFFRTNYPEYYSTYQRLPVFIQKIDFFRYLAIYHYGGFYFDVDIQPLLPIDDAICNHHSVFPVDEYVEKGMCLSDRFAPICKKKQEFLLGQYAFGAVPKHPFIKLLVDTIHKNIDMYVEEYKKAKNREVYVYRTTGPDFVSYLYSDYGRKDLVYILSNGKRQMFGDYARHDYYGSWK
jgi:mannosyltransferase OCH1-like enzyme